MNCSHFQAASPRPGAKSGLWTLDSRRTPVAEPGSLRVLNRAWLASRGCLESWGVVATGPGARSVACDAMAVILFQVLGRRV